MNKYTRVQNRAPLFGCVLAGIAAHAGAAYAASGDLDPGFGTNGVALVNFQPLAGGTGAVGNARTDVDPQGRIWAAAMVDGTTRGLGLARLTRDGALDPTFGTGGMRHVAAADPAYFRFVDLHVGRDGHAYVAYEDGAAPTWRLCRLAENGTFDTTWIATGCVGVAMPGASLRTLAVNPVDGHVVLVGTGLNAVTSLYEPAVAEFDGTTLNSGRIPVPGANIEVRAATYAANGELFVTGTYSQPGANRDAYVGHVARSGGVFTFELLGTVFYNVAGTYADLGSCIAVTRDGKLQIGVVVEAANGRVEWGSARFSAPQTLDPNYGFGGKTAEFIADADHTATGDEDAIAGCVATYDGGFTLAGHHSFVDPAPPTSRGTALAVHRLRADGSADQSFGGDLAAPGTSYGIGYAGTAIDYLRPAGSAGPHGDYAFSISVVPHSGATIVGGASLRPGPIADGVDLAVARVLGDGIFHSGME